MPTQQAQADTKPPPTPSTPTAQGGPPPTPDIKMMPPETPKDEKLFPGLSATADVDKVSFWVNFNLGVQGSGVAVWVGAGRVGGGSSMSRGSEKGVVVWVGEGVAVWVGLRGGG